MNFIKDLTNDFGMPSDINLPTETLTENLAAATLSGGGENINKGPFANLKLDTVLWIIIILIIVGLIIFCLCKKYFQNTNENITDSKKVKFAEDYKFGNDLIMMCNDSCPYSNKMKEDLQKSNHMLNNKKVKYVQFNSDEGKAIRKNVGVMGTPALINYLDNKPIAVVMGYSPLDDLIKKLDGSKDEPDKSSNTNNELLLIGNNSCGFCNKQKQHYDSKNIKYRFVDSNSPEGMKFMTKNDARGVPLLINIVDGKETVNIGYSESFP